MAFPDGGTLYVGWRVAILMQLVYQPPMWMTRTVLPVGTGRKSIERERSICRFKA